MSLRFNAIHGLSSKPDVLVDGAAKITAIFNSNVFTLKTAREFLSDEAYKSLQSSIKAGHKIDRAVANQIATGIRAWAEAKGVSHFTHWFQPLTGTTAEKHDSFFTLKGDGTPIEQFEGDALVQQEPDASSFPSGGLRATFEARGYTAWDPSSPPFIMEIGQGKTLCIPTIFVSYTGESLDYKAPLLKALDALNKAAVDVCNYFDKNVSRVTATLGWEQEYFVIDEAMFNARPDLVMTGRTVYGHTSAKNQQLEDHYFGSIPERIYTYMRDFETESYKLGIPLRTRHNEVAPAQFECAPIFEEVSVAVDHNSLLMDVMDRVARRHNLRVLLHEKPFAGINGSGKHNNWSLATNTGENLLNPGKTSEENLRFATILVNILKALHTYEELVRASIASASNDLRLGGNEAPPAIISAFIGEQLTKTLDEIEGMPSPDGLAKSGSKGAHISIPKIPEILLDNTDRNRTSPFAFTGNKFEFRAVGSSDHCANAIIVLNTIVGEQLVKFKKDVDALIKKKVNKILAIEQVLKSYVKASKKIIFEGNGYSDEWVKEAAKRGLSNIKTTPYALDAYSTKQTKELFVKNNIFTDKELEARTEIKYENYVLKIQIEGRILGELVKNYIVPSAVEYQKKLIDTIEGLNRIGQTKAQNKYLYELAKEISMHINSIWENNNKMVEERKKANNLTHADKKAKAYCDKVKPYFDEIRESADKLEELIDNDAWKLPKYRDLLFLK